MTYQTIISCDDLQKNLDNPNWVVIDCRFSLDDPEAGFNEYQEGHIPGAQYVNLDQDLSSPVIPGVTGRHPLPDIQVFASLLSNLGIDDSTQVIAYDSRGGGLAARLWWLLNWLGHKEVSILDGGWPAWERSEFPVEIEINKREKRNFVPLARDEMIASIEFVDEIREDIDFLLIDSRSAERYWGLAETIDSRAGHIPGAVSAPFEANLTKDGYFLEVGRLKERFSDLLDGLPSEQIVFYCGSGVTAAHNILSMVAAGFDMPKLYPGSWSEWCADPERPGEP